MKTYQIILKCDNCHFEDAYIFSWGTRISNCSQYCNFCGGDDLFYVKRKEE